ncbi:unnamed protein product [Nezara viridula]|uniref:Knr4/Smi1-like domain-containing protein n=1 Tax=Nezara viridula TaxID=85310 RepID=A0A9P0ECW0_NEZVI|nr:unnamed protein product [Nezara viridula]
MTSGSELFSEEQFYDDLTLNLIKSLDWIPGVHNIKLDKRQPCEKTSILAWEQRQCCQLPLDLKNFYLSVDGFELTYDFRYAGELLTVGRLCINSLMDLRRIYGYSIIEQSGELLPSLKDLDIVNTVEGKPSFGPNSKIFELDYNEGVSMVCLVYNDSSHAQEIWFLDRSLNWFKLASNFSQYFRMMLYHHGLPEWQFLHVGIGLSPWAEQLMIAIAPHLVSPEPAKKVVSRSSEPQIDPNIFKVRHKLSKKNKDKKKYLK